MNLHVFQQIHISGKSLTAYVTDEGFLVTVDHPGSLQVVSQGESLGADFTHMLPGAGCSHFTFSVTVVTNSSTRSGRVWTLGLRFLTMK